MELRIVSANFYVGNRHKREDRRRLRRTGADSIGVQEGQHLGGVWRYVRKSKRGRGSTNGSREVPILVRFRRVSVRRWWARQMSRDLGSGIAQDRWTTVVRFEKDGQKVAHLNTHFNAAIQARSGRAMTGLARVQEYRRHMRALLDLARAQRAAGWAPVVTGDFNYRPKGRLRRVKRAALWYWSPHRSFPRAAMGYRSSGLDGVAWDWKTFRPSGPLEEIWSRGSNHLWIAQDLRTK